MGEETQYSSFAVSIYFPELVTSPIKGFAEVPPHCSFDTPLNQVVMAVAGGVWHTRTPGSHGGGRWSLVLALMCQKDAVVIGPKVNPLCIE